MKELIEKMKKIINFFTLFNEDYKKMGVILASNLIYLKEYSLYENEVIKNSMETLKDIYKKEEIQKFFFNENDQNNGIESKLNYQTDPNKIFIRLKKYHDCITELFKYLDENDFGKLRPKIDDALLLTKELRDVCQAPSLPSISSSSSIPSSSTSISSSSSSSSASSGQNNSETKNNVNSSRKNTMDDIFSYLVEALMNQELCVIRDKLNNIRNDEKILFSSNSTLKNIYNFIIRTDVNELTNKKQLESLVKIRIKFIEEISNCKEINEFSSKVIKFMGSKWFFISNSESNIIFVVSAAFAALDTNDQSVMFKLRKKLINQAVEILNILNKNHNEEKSLTNFLTKEPFYPIPIFIAGLEDVRDNFGKGIKTREDAYKKVKSDNNKKYFVQEFTLLDYILYGNKRACENKWLNHDITVFNTKYFIYSLLSSLLGSAQLFESINKQYVQIKDKMDYRFKDFLPLLEIFLQDDSKILSEVQVCRGYLNPTGNSGFKNNISIRISSSDILASASSSSSSNSSGSQDLNRPSTPPLVIHH